MSKKSKQRVSEIISGMGLGMTILTEFVRRAKERGISNQEFHRLATPEGAYLFERFLDIMQDPQLVGNYKVDVRYGMSLEKALKAGKFEYEDYNLERLKEFPLGRRVDDEMEILLFDFRRMGKIPYIYVPQVLVWLDDHGFRPAELLELLALGNEHPNAQKEHVIVGLGSIYAYTGKDGEKIHYVALLYGGEGKKHDHGIGTQEIALGFNTSNSYVFAAVRKHKEVDIEKLCNTVELDEFLRRLIDSSNISSGQDPRLPGISVSKKALPVAS